MMSGRERRQSCGLLHPSLLLRMPVDVSQDLVRSGPSSPCTAACFPPVASASSSPSLRPLQLPVSSVYLQVPAIFHHGSVYRTELSTSVGKRSRESVCSCSWAPDFMASRTNSACVTYIWIRACWWPYAAPACITLASNHTASPQSSNNLTIVPPSFESIHSWPPDCRDTSTVPGAVP